MQKTLSNVKSLFINKHFQQLVEARDRADDVYTSNMTLGEGMRAEILAATGAASIDELIDQAVVIKRLKRSALIQVHNLLYYANQWGVMMCSVPAKCPIGRFNCVHGPGITFAGGPEILQKLGVTRIGVGMICLHDYSKCVETKVDWLN
jgi:hypothetical protein